MRSFNYHKPTSIEQVSQLLATLENPQLLAGGQTLLPNMKSRESTPSDLIKISHLLSHDIDCTADTVKIGAGITHVELAKSTDIAENLLPEAKRLTAGWGRFLNRVHAHRVGQRVSLNVADDTIPVKGYRNHQLGARTFVQK